MSDFKAEMHFGSADPAGGAYITALPRPLAGFKGAYF